MANKRFRGDAKIATDVWTWTISSNTAAQTFSLARNGKTYGYVVVGGESTSDIATALQALLAASTEPEFVEYTWTVNTNVVTGTSKVAGRPATFTKGGTGTSTLTNATPATGPRFWSNDNFDAATPGTGDDIYIFGTNVPILYNLDQSGVALGSVDISLSHEANIGNPPFNKNGTLYHEDRTRPLIITCTNLYLGTGSGRGGGCWYIKPASTNIYVYGSGTSDDPNYHPIRMYNNSTTANLKIFGGQVDLDPYNIGGSNYTNVLVTGRGACRSNRLTSMYDVVVEKQGSFFATVVSGANAYNSLTMRDSAVVRIDGDGSASLDTIPIVKLLGGRLDWTAIGKVSTFTIGANATLDTSNLVGQLTISNCTLAAGARIYDPNGKIVFTNAIVLSNCGLEDVDLTLGKNVTLQRTVS